MNDSSYKEKCRFCRQQLANTQRSSQFNGKKSLGARLIEQRTRSLTKESVDRELEELSFKLEIDGMLAQLTYHIRFYSVARPVTGDEKIKEWARNIRDLQRQFSANQISAKQYFECLDSLDKEVVENISNVSQCI